MSEFNSTVLSSREPIDDEKADHAVRKSSSSSRDSDSSRYNNSSGDDDDINDVNQQERLERCSTKHSAMGDAPIQPVDSIIEIPDVFYDKLPAHRKSEYIDRLTNLLLYVHLALNRNYSHHPRSGIFLRVSLASFEYVGAGSHAGSRHGIQHDWFDRESRECTLPLIHGIIADFLGTNEPSLVSNPKTHLLFAPVVSRYRY